MTLAPDHTGKYPHCNTSNRFERALDRYNDDHSKLFMRHEDDRMANLQMCRCTNCGKIIILFQDRMVYPLGATRNSAPKEIPTTIGKDFNEACLVESLSSKASAALARRCFKTCCMSKE